MLAIIFAGGKAKRMQGANKPVIKLYGKELISYVIDAIEESKKVSEILIALRRENRELVLFIERKKFRKKAKITFTSGRGYVHDLKELAQSIKEKAIVLPCDMPFLRGSIIDSLIERYEKSGKRAACVYLPLKVFKELDTKPSISFTNIAPCSINFIDFSDLNAEEDKIIVDFRELAFNINTAEDLERAEKEIEKLKRLDYLNLFK